MGAFDTSEATALTREEMEKLKVAGAGDEIKAKLQACGATGGEVQGRKNIGTTAPVVLRKD